MKRSFILFAFFFFALACLPRFFSLHAHWSSDEARWLHRSAAFMSAVKKGEFSETLIAYHPGVTTMWIAGLRTFFTKPRLDVSNLARARWFIGIVVSAGIGFVALLLYKLFGLWVALVGSAALIYSPFFLAQTRRVHTDALATTFILLTVLLFLIYCQNRQHRWHLIFSGVTFGLAILSKSYALILLPWIPLCLLLFGNEKQRGRFLTSITEISCFLNCSILTVLILWPVFWTPFFSIMAISLLGITLFLLRNLRTPQKYIGLVLLSSMSLAFIVFLHVAKIAWVVFNSVNWAVTTAHEVEHFFLGEIVSDPGWFFYPFVLTIKSTPLMLPLALAGCVLLWKQRKQTKNEAHQFRVALALVASIVLFMLCLSATSKKLSRYLLPAFPMLEILSAIGLVEGLRWSYALLRPRFGTQETNQYKAAFAAILGTGFFFVQILPVLILHPHYGTYYNLCWKGTDITKIVTVGEASGMDIAAKYMNQKANARQLRVAVSPLGTSFFQYYFTGLAYNTRKKYLPADYEVVYIRDSQIGKVPQRGTRNGQLERTITLNGMDLVWIYHIPPKEGTQ